MMNNLLKRRHSKTLKIIDNTILDICGNPVTTTHVSIVVVRNSFVSRQYIFFRYFQLSAPLNKIMITYWDIFGEFRFYNMRFNRGRLLKREFGPSSKPCPFFDVLIVFFYHANRITAHLPPCSKKRRRWFKHSNTRGSRSSLRCLLSYASRNAVLLVLLPNLGAPLPVIFLIASIASIANGISKLAKTIALLCFGWF